GGAALPLPPLTEEETARLAGALTGAPAGPRLRSVLAFAGGNPRYVRTLTAALTAAGAVVVRDGTAEVTDPALAAPPHSFDADAPWRTVDSGSPLALAEIVDHLGHLSAGALDTLRAAALLGAEFTAADLATVMEQTPRTLLPALDEALAAGLLDTAEERLRFRHPVVRQALHASLPRTVRAALHRAAARALADAGAPVETVADQLLGAGELMDGWAPHWLVRAADPLVARLPGTASRLIRWAVSHVHALDAPDRALLEERLAAAAVLLRRPDSVDMVVALRDRAADPARRAALDEILVRGLLARDRYAEALEVTEAALREPAIGPERATRLTGFRALVLSGRGRHAEAAALAEQAVARAAVLGDPAALAQAHHALSMVLVRRRRSAESVRQMALGVRAARRSAAAGDLRLHILMNQADLLCALDRPAEARAALDEAKEVAVAAGSVGRLAGVAATRAILEFWTGHWPAALECVAAALRLSVADAWMPPLAHGLAALILGHRDCRREARERVELVERVGEGPCPPGGSARANSTYLLLARALLAEREGDIGAALAVLAAALLPDHAADLGQERVWLLPDTVRLAVDAGDAGTARAAVAAAEQEAAADPGHPGLAAAAARCRGLLGQDPGPIRQAVAYYQDVSRPLLLGRAWEDLATAAAWRGDLDTARDALHRAVGLYDRLGAAWDTTRADARLRPLGVRRGRRAARRRPATGWEALTPAELKVALLVADGRSNPEIAAELYLSRRTVQTHVSHILGKLGLRSRTEVAREAARDRVPEP
ncbi:LuxR C-terminal-related transcriptional regulator, partial [Streptomyces sp. URMC 123]|uniref:helix-turn-helix transcriptional regulator n=1 Tax=Streptomyces sp. URMC 123 TaxID=3423403 RepID=UPI003F1C5A89